MSVVAQFLQEVKIAGEPPSKDQLTSARQGLRDALEENDALRDQIRQDLEELGRNAAQIEQNFAVVYDVVNELDGRNMMQNNEHFGPRWEELHKRYSATLADSKASTHQLHDQIHDFVYVLLPMIESDSSDVVKQEIKTRQLGDYIGKLAAFHKPAVERGNQFLRLKWEVTRFHKDLDYALPNNDNQLHNQMKSLRDDIDRVNKGIDELRQQDNQLGQSTDNFFSFFAEIVTSDIEERRNNINHQIQDKVNQLSELRQQLDHVERNEDCMHRIMNLLATHTSWFNKTSEKLTGIEGIWRMLSNDVCSLHEGLEPMEEEEEAFIYDLQANSVRPVYEALESALEAYASAF